VTHEIDEIYTNVEKRLPLFSAHLRVCITEDELDGLEKVTFP
jgi:hypothetical protein